MLEVSVAPEKIFNFLGFPVTNTFFWTLVLGAGIFIFFFFSFRKSKVVPGPLQNFFEWVLEGLFNYIDGITGDRKKTLEIFPLASFLFIFIFCANLLEVSPGLGVFHIIRSPSSDLNFTLALAIVSIIFVEVLTVKNLRFPKYLKRYFNFKNPILLFVGLFELMGILTRMLSLAVRLFGNLFAGEVLLMIAVFLCAYILPLPFLGLEIFVGFVQALIFSSLIVIFYVASTEQTEE